MSKLLYKILGTPIGVFSSGKVPKDGDGDGMFTLGDEDNVPINQAIEIARKMARDKVRKFIKDNPEREDRVRKILARAKEGGFSVNRTKKDDIVTGISIGRNKHGIKKPQSEMFDELGNPTDEAVRLVMSWLSYHGEKIFDEPLEGAREVGVGGWIEDDLVYFDIIDVYDNNSENQAKAVERGKKQNQIAVADLDEIQKALETGDWSKTLIRTGGDGAETIDTDLFEDLMEIYKSIPEGADLQVTLPPKNTVSEKLTSLKNFRIMIISDSKETK